MTTGLLSSSGFVIKNVVTLHVGTVRHFAARSSRYSWYEKKKRIVYRYIAKLLYLATK